MDDIKSFGIYFSNAKKYIFKTPEDLRNIIYSECDHNRARDILCFAIVYIKKNGLDISWMSTHPRYRNMGLATLLIKKIIKICNKKYITLDDCSGALPPKNIYFKLGFQVRSSGDTWIPWTIDNLNVSEERRLTISSLTSTSHTQDHIFAGYEFFVVAQ